MPELRIRVEEGHPTMPWSKIRAMRRNSLKESEKRDLTRLIAAMKSHGFAFPFHVWAGHDFVIDGAGRVPAVEAIANDPEWTIPDRFPVTLIEAETEREAGEFVLMASSSHGKVTQESLLGFASEMEVDLRLAGPEIDLSLHGFGDEALALLLDGGSPGGGGEEGGNAYTQKIESPVYLPQGEHPPPVADLYDRTTYDRLARDIQEADVPEEVREFLMLAACRHTALNFQRIADYYAHAPEEVQRLMEDSALVIVDFKRAIELGFVRLNERITEAFRKDYPDA